MTYKKKNSSIDPLQVGIDYEEKSQKKETPNIRDADRSDHASLILGDGNFKKIYKDILRYTLINQSVLRI